MSGARLSDAQERALRALNVDGQCFLAHHTEGNYYVQHASGRSLVRLGLAYVSDPASHLIGITAAGREWLAQHDGGME